MNRFFLNPKCINESSVQFPEDIRHQIVNVLRLKSGDRVAVLDNSGQVYTVSLVIDTESKTVRGNIVESRNADTEPAVNVDLYFGLTHRDKMEWILQKGTEIGVGSFRPFVSSRTLVQKLALSQKRLTRWEKIIREAAEQSHRGRLPLLHSPQTFSACLADVESSDDLALIAWEGADPSEGRLKDQLSAFSGRSIALFIGPEGGFSEDEVEQAKSAGCQVVSLGKRILRMETAAIIFPALVLFTLDQA